MDMKTWLAATTAAERQKVAKAAGTSVGYFDQLAGGHRKPSPALARALVEASKKQTPDRVMTIAGLRPDLAALLGEAAA